MKKTILLAAAAFLICSTVIVFAGHKTDSYDLEIYSGEKLFYTMPVPPQPPDGFIYSYSIYRVPKDQSALTREGAHIYAFQIVPGLEDGLVKVEVVALLEDPNTVSEEHPLHKFKKQPVGSYSIRVGESIIISEMTKLGAKPLTLKMVARS
jgi:hypothetical protein